jgi:hypothetical protein
VGARVRKLLQGTVELEGPNPFNAGWAPERVALLAQWSDEPRLSRSMRTLVAQLREADFDVVLVSACEAPGELEWVGGRPDRVAVLRKPNVGYDFGSWTIGLERFPEIARAPHVLLANDSLVGPFAPIRPLLEDFLSSPTDTWGATDNTQQAHHLQSFFFGFSGGILADPILQKFWADVRQEDLKWKIITKYEVGLSRLLWREGYTRRAMFPNHTVATELDNPAISGWLQLLEAGFPWVKRELLFNADLEEEGAAEVPATVMKLFGEDVWEWL